MTDKKTDEQIAAEKKHKDEQAEIKKAQVKVDKEAAQKAAEAKKKMLAAEKKAADAAKAKDDAKKPLPRKGSAPVKKLLNAIEAAQKAAEECYNKKDVPPHDRVNYVRDYLKASVSNLEMAIPEIEAANKKK